MKERISRLARGIMEETPEKMKISPESFDEMLWPDREQSFSVEVAALSGHSLRGVAFCDDEHILLDTASFTGRMNHLFFRVSAEGLLPGELLTGSLSLLSSAGEKKIPYRFTVAVPEPEEREVLPGTGCGPDAVTQNPERITPSGECSGESTAKETGAETPGTPAGGLFFPDPEEEKNRAFLMRHLPEDPELLIALCEELIRLGAADSLSYVFYKEAIRKELSVTHLYESFVEAYPEDCPDPMPDEVLLYFSYEKDLPQETADRIYRNVIENVSPETELYKIYEPSLRDYAMRNVLLSRISRNLAVLYDRMLYPDMIDGKAAFFLPDLLNTVRITLDDASVSAVHLRYPELSTLLSRPVRDGVVYLPLYQENAVLSFCGEGGREARGISFRKEKLLHRPDLLERCYQICPSQEMHLLSESERIVTEGIREEEEKKFLLLALDRLPLSDAFRKEVLRTLCAFGGDTSWTQMFSPAEFDRDSGNLVFQAYLSEGRYRDAYLCLRMTGAEEKEAADLSALCTALLSRGEKPMENGAQTERTFLCLCKKVLDQEAATPTILDFLMKEYEGPTEEMYQLLKKAEDQQRSVTEFAEKTLLCMLFAGAAEHLDDTFRAYTETGVQKELLVRAYFAVRMTDYVIRADETVPETAFQALERYLGLTKHHESMPPVFLIGLTKYYNKKDSLTENERDLCQELTDLLISRGLIFPYTKALRKKIRIPAGICERFYVEYQGTPESSPEMRIRVNPGGEDFRNVPLRKVFGNIFVAGIVLFSGEEMQYLIYDRAAGKSPAAEGTVRVKKTTKNGEDRYSLLNGLTREKAERDPETLKKEMMSYALLREVNKELFSLNACLQESI